MKGVNENVLARRTLAQSQYRNRYFQQLIDAANSAMEPDGEAAGELEQSPRLARTRGGAHVGADPFGRAR